MAENSKETQIQEESRWYILHTYSGHEDKVSENLKQRIENLDLLPNQLPIMKKCLKNYYQQ